MVGRWVLTMTNHTTIPGQRRFCLTVALLQNLVGTSVTRGAIHRDVRLPATLAVSVPFSRGAGRERGWRCQYVQQCSPSQCSAEQYRGLPSEQS